MVEVRAFDGDFQEVSDLIKASWTEDYRGYYKQPVMDYSNIDFLEWNLKKPNAEPLNLLGAYKGKKLVGFLGTFAVSFRYNDIELKGVSGSFCTIHVDYKKMGMGKALMREATRLGIREGLDISCSVPDEGHPMEKILEDICKEFNVGYFKPQRFTFLSKPLDKNKMLELATYPLYQQIALHLFSKKSKGLKLKIDESNTEKEIASICNMLNASYKNDTLCVVWDEELLSSQLRCKISNYLYINRDDRKALINYFTIDLLGCREPFKKHKMTMIDNVYFENMSFIEKHRLISDFCADQKRYGSCAITVPTLPDFDLKPFYSNCFIPAGRYHNYFIQDLKNRLHGKVKAGYLFVR
jgi:hypothetical protein